MKKTVSLFVALLFSLCVFTFSVSAQNPNVVDEADILTTQEEAELETSINRIRDTYDFEVVILTVNSTEGKSAEAFADDYYDYNGYGVDSQNSGVLFLVDMGGRNWFISTAGEGISLIADAEIDYMEYEIIPYLSQGHYSYSFTEFVSVCEEILDYNSRGESFVEANGYDSENYYYEDNYIPQSFNFFKNAIIALATGFVIALIVVLSMKSKLKTVRAKSGAADYVVAGSMNVTRSDERFLYRHVTRTPRQQNNSNGRSGGGVRVGSSGSSHGGRGGRF